MIDYTKQDFTKNGKRYDLILDAIALRSIFDYKRALAPGGRFVMIGGSTSRLIQTLCVGPMIKSRKI